jgi:hypothetical protein
MEPTGINRPDKKDLPEPNGKHPSACMKCKRPLTNYLSIKLGMGITGLTLQRYLGILPWKNQKRRGFLHMMNLADRFF